MQIDPVLEWQRLTGEYRQKGEGELLELARDFTDLTETAQQALRAEMQTRGLGDPANPKTLIARESPAANSSAMRSADSVDQETSSSSGEDSETDEAQNQDDDSHDYTWKTVLCECETSDHAWQLVQALRQAGLDGWVDGNGLRSRVLVAADQLDQAQVIAAGPIPQEIVDEPKEEIPEFVEPKCPKCGSDDVVLEAVDPENTWRCEQCDAQWTESLSSTEEESPKA